MKACEMLCSWKQTAQINFERKSKVEVFGFLLRSPDCLNAGCSVLLMIFPNQPDFDWIIVKKHSTGQIAKRLLVTKLTCVQFLCVSMNTAL